MVFAGWAAAMACSWGGVFLKDASASALCWGCCGRPLIQDCRSRWSRLHTPVRLRYSIPYSHRIKRCTSAARHRPTPSLPSSGGRLTRAWSEAICSWFNLGGRPARLPSLSPAMPSSLYQVTQCRRFSRLIPYCSHTHCRARPSIISRIASSRCEVRTLPLRRLATNNASGLSCAISAFICCPLPQAVVSLSPSYLIVIKYVGFGIIGHVNPEGYQLSPAGLDAHSHR